MGKQGGLYDTFHLCEYICDSKAQINCLHFTATVRIRNHANIELNN